MKFSDSSIIPFDGEDAEMESLIRILRGQSRTTSPAPPSAYRNKRVAFLTQHGKERVVAPILKAKTESSVELITGFDTDIFGTFTGDTERDGTQLETARKKAQQGMALSDLSIGLGSEGSFGSHPACGFLPWNVEMLVWIDMERELEIVGVSTSVITNHNHLKTCNWEELQAFAGTAGFPDHHLVVSPNDNDGLQFREGIADFKALKDAFDWAVDLATNGNVFVETDMRAHANPMRMENIAAATKDLAEKLRCLCPVCEMPGFSLSECVPGLPCESCYLPTEITTSEIHHCQSCQYSETKELNCGSRYASKEVCQHCNP